jgi:filamentous hemagglutinin family protein
MNQKLLCTLFILFSIANGVYAEVIFDGSMNASTAGKKLEGNIEITPDLGQIEGENLFHSFHTFHIQSHETATFSGPDAIKNVISRVTGGETSLIDGHLKSEMPNANFYLLNPAGVMIGENASIDIKGSFHISTADYLTMKNADTFVVHAEKTLLSMSEPMAFGFLDKNIGKIEITNNRKLTMGVGKTISLIASDIVIDNSYITASEGRINIASLSSCEISLMHNGLIINGEFKGGSLHILNRSKLTVNGTGSGDIYMMGICE